MDDNSQFAIKYGDLNYLFAFDIFGKQLRIACKHPTQFYEWETTITEDLEKSSNEHMKLTMSPDHLFDLFTKYKHGQLNEYTEITLQEKMKSHTVEISIVIISHAPFDHDESESKQILLYPKNISTKERNSRILQQRDLHIDTLSNKVKELSDEINKLKTKILDPGNDEKLDIYKKEELDQKFWLYNHTIETRILCDFAKIKEEMDEIKKQQLHIIKTYPTTIELNAAIKSLSCIVSSGYSRTETYTRNEINEIIAKNYCTKDMIVEMAAKKTDYYTKAEINTFLNALVNEKLKVTPK